MSKDVVEIPLTRGQVAIVDAIDSDLASLRWCVRPGDRTYYAMRRSRKENRTIHLHRVILARMLGRELVEDDYADHINGDALDNRRCNLRLATRSQNVTNSRRRQNSKSGYKGVTWSRSQEKWRARIGQHGKQYWLGYFNTPQEAYAAYCGAARVLFGEFARFE